MQGDSGRAGSSALLGAAVAVFVLYAIGLVALGTPPGASETGAQVVAWFREHGHNVRWFVWALTVATPPLAIMFALLRRLLPAPHRDVFTIGAVTYIATTAAGVWTWAALALHADRLEPATARAIRFSSFLWSGPDRNDNDDDGTRNVSGTDRACGATAMAGGSQRARFHGAGNRDCHDFWDNRLYRAGRRDEL